MKHVDRIGEKLIMLARKFSPLLGITVMLLLTVVMKPITSTTRAALSTPKTVEPTSERNKHTGHTSTDLPQIVNGQDILEREFPFTVALKRNGEFFCGGTLIDPWIVMTAAHCTEGKDASELSVTVGSDFHSGPDGKTIGVADYESHISHYSHVYDISLILLDSPSSSPTVKIATSSEMDEYFATGDEAWATGWGITEDGNTSDMLKKLKVTINFETFLDPVCWRYLAGLSWRHSFDRNLVFCAGNADGGVYVGDSGGPLVTRIGENWVLGGIISGGERFSGYFVALYTKIDEFETWIKVNSATLKSQTTPTPTPTSIAAPTTTPTPTDRPTPITVCSDQNRDGTYWYSGKNYTGSCTWIAEAFGEVLSYKPSSVRFKGEYEAILFTMSGKFQETLNADEADITWRSIFSHGQDEPRMVDVFWTGSSDSNNLVKLIKVNSPNAHNWSVATVGKGDKVYGDRDYVIEGMPPQLPSRMTLIKTANNDKGEIKSDLVKFQVKADVGVIVFFDEDHDTKPEVPDWLKDRYERKPWLYLDLSDGSEQLDGWECVAPAGDTITLGGANAPGGRPVTSNYVIGIRPKNDVAPEDTCNGSPPKPPTPTHTPTRVPTHTPTPTNTITPSATPTPSPTPTFTRTPTPTPRSKLNLEETGYGWLDSTQEKWGYHAEVFSGDWMSVRVFKVGNTEMRPRIRVFDTWGVNLLAESIDNGYAFVSVQTVPPGFPLIEVSSRNGVFGAYNVRVEKGRQAAVGDMDRNCVVDRTDVDLIVAQIGTSDPDSDLTLNGIVDVGDLGVVAANYGKTCPALTPTPTPTPTPTQAPVLPEFFDGFEDPTSDWEISENDIATFGYANNEYLIGWYKKGYYGWVRAPFLVSDPDHYEVEVEARAYITDTVTYGLLFDLINGQNQSSFSVDPHERKYLVRRREVGGTGYYSGWISNDNILGGNATNKLKLVRKRDEVSLYINEVLVETVSLNSLSGQEIQVGVYSEPGTSVPSYAYYDNFRFKANPDTPTPTATSTGTTIPPTHTPTGTPTYTPTSTNTVTPTPSSTATPTGTAVPPTHTPTGTPTYTPTSTNTVTPTPSSTATPTGTAVPPTHTPTGTPTPTSTSIPTGSEYEYWLYLPSLYR